MIFLGNLGSETYPILPHLEPKRKTEETNHSKTKSPASVLTRQLSPSTRSTARKTSSVLNHSDDPTYSCPCSPAVASSRWISKIVGSCGGERGCPASRYLRVQRAVRISDASAASVHMNSCLCGKSALCCSIRVRDEWTRWEHRWGHRWGQWGATVNVMFANVANGARRSRARRVPAKSHTTRGSSDMSGTRTPTHGHCHRRTRNESTGSRLCKKSRKRTRQCRDADLFILQGAEGK
jgi:hypothetical protein